MESPLVRCRMGLAKVNWARDGLCGITWLEGAMRGLSNVVRIDEVEWVEGKPDENSDIFDVSQLSDEELRQQLEAIRSLRIANGKPTTSRPQGGRVHARQSRSGADVKKLLGDPAVLEALRGLLLGKDGGE